MTAGSDPQAPPEGLVRPMAEADVPAAVGVWLTAHDDLRRRFGEEPAPHTPALHRRLERRIANFLGTDPSGSWVAEREGEVTGLAQASLRDGHWVLSLLGVVPSAQNEGQGGQLLRAALGHGGGGRSGSIQASQDPRAVALYSRAGFEAHPARTAVGPVALAPPRPTGVRRGDGRDLATVQSIDRAVRGSDRSVDIEFLLGEPGNRLLVDGGRGYAVAMDDRLVTLAARDEEAAVRLLRTALTEVPEGGIFEVSWLTRPQQWAVRTLVEARLQLKWRGTVMTRGKGPFPNYIPSGGYG